MSRLKYVHYASRSQLSSVDLSGNTKLTTLNLAYNSLASIDLSANTALTSVTLTGNGRTITPLEQDVNGCKTYYIPLSKLEKTLGDGFKVAKLNKTTLSGGEITTINGEEAYGVTYTLETSGITTTNVSIFFYVGETVCGITFTDFGGTGTVMDYVMPVLDSITL